MSTAIPVSLVKSSIIDFSPGSWLLSQIDTERALLSVLAALPVFSELFPQAVREVHKAAAKIVDSIRFFSLLRPPCF